MMKRNCSLTFEEPLENVGTTSKEHHEKYNTPLLLSLENLYVQCFSASFLLVLTFDISLHGLDKHCYLRSLCET